MAKKADVKKDTRPANALTESVSLLEKIFSSKKMSNPFVTLNEDDFTTSLPHIPTGSITIDYLMGGKLNRYGVPPCPGFPKGRVVNLYGQESSGKTTLALTVAANVIAMGGTVAYIDFENAIVPSYAKTLGVPIEDKHHFMLMQPETLEQGITILYACAIRGVDLIVIDSVGAGIPKAVMEQGLDEKGSSGRVGALAQMWSNILPQIRTRIMKSGSCVVGISQLRKTINTSGYGDASGTTTQGGEAWKFYSDIRFGLRRIKTEKNKEFDALSHSSKDEISTGTKIKAKADKCKVSAMQGREVEFYIRFGEGIDDLRSVVEFAEKVGIVHRDSGSSWYSWERPDGEVLKIQGMEKFKEAVRSTPNGIEELRRVTKERLYASDIPLVAEDDKTEEEELLDIESILSAGSVKPAETSEEAGS
jgi:recombination protein RecA